MRPVFGVPSPEVYLDNAATTMIDPEVLRVMQAFLEENYGNPETFYHLGQQAKEAVGKAREQVAELLEVSPERVFFTSGGTEANNWALKGVHSYDPRSLIVSAIEHSSVLRPAEFLHEKSTCSSLAKIPVDSKGRLDVDSLKAQLAKTIHPLVSIQYANNEIGTIQDIKTISQHVKNAGALFHVDAVQAFGKIPVLPENDGIDLLSISAHKIHGPMGVGALYIAPGVGIDPLIHGGQQEFGMRAGTIPVHQIVGFGEAAELVRCTMKTDMPRLKAYLDDLEIGMTEAVNARRNGDKDNCLPNIISLTIPSVEGSLLASMLNTEYGICIGCGSACSRGAKSHVLEAIGLDEQACRSTIRVSLSRLTTERDVKSLYATVQAAIKMVKERLV